MRPLTLPEPGVADAWCADVDALLYGDAPAGILSEDELERAARYRFERDRRRYTARRLMLRVLLGKYLARDPAEVRLSYGPYGKPGAENAGALCFNLSHSHGEAVYAFTAGQRVGVDVEQIRAGVDTEAIARSFFSDEECRAIRTFDRSEWPAAFFRCWTRKEAYVKALGEGLSFPLKAFDVSLETTGPGRLLRSARDPEQARLWTFYPFEPRSGYLAVVALEQAAGAPRVRRITNAQDLAAT
ncbi:MAG: 4'-phosphopantetheinyl transferase superfamily protein [Acidobacteria bacterium]|nr:4'-phosphopantetheinyl transferase superfamily protein [Acidobacteriota bacterium]